MDKDLQIKLLLKELKEKDEEIRQLKNINDKTELEALRKEMNYIKIHGLKPLSMYDNTHGSVVGGATYDTPRMREARRRGLATVL